MTKTMLCKHQRINLPQLLDNQTLSPRDGYRILPVTYHATHKDTVTLPNENWAVAHTLPTAKFKEVCGQTNKLRSLCQKPTGCIIFLYPISCLTWLWSTQTAVFLSSF